MIRSRTALARAWLAVLIAVLLSTLLTPTAHAGGTVAAAPAPIHSVTYKTWFDETFSRGDSPLGQWQTGPYAKRLSVYDGACETGEMNQKTGACKSGGPVVYDRDTVSVEGGRLKMFGYKRVNPVTQQWEPVGAGVAPLLGGKYVGFRYGQFSFDLAVEPGPGGASQWWFASVLWPQATPGYPGGDWCLGELDWPEFVPGEWAKAFQHVASDRRADGSCTGNPVTNCWSTENRDWVTTGTHRYTMTWLPTGVTYLRDGVQVGFSNCSVPDVPMQLKLQLVSLYKQIPPNEWVTIWIDNIKIDKAYYQQG